MGLGGGSLRNVLGAQLLTDPPPTKIVSFFHFIVSLKKHLLGTYYVPESCQALGSSKAPVAGRRQTTHGKGSEPENSRQWYRR